jgi:mannose-6-phosphate isomerase-like protein (cupin superfamily)
VDGILAGEGELSKSSEHAGERHLDGDEVLYLVSGAMRLSLELDEGGTTEIPLDQGQAVIVPQGVWHRLIIDAPIRLLYFGGGRTEIRSPV